MAAPRRVGLLLVSTRWGELRVCQRLWARTLESDHAGLPVLFPTVRRRDMVELLATVGNRAVRRHPDAGTRAHRHRVRAAARDVLLRAAGWRLPVDQHGCVRS